jgi:sugar phosphate isomerase/epimerase
MRVGLSTDGLPHLSRQEVLSWCAQRGINDVEMCVGPWARRFHLDLPALLAEHSERDRLMGELKEHGITLAAINGSGNPLHPTAVRRAEAVAALRGAIELAALLGVDRVIAMGGCPGGRRGGDVGVFAIWSMVLDDEALWEWQFEHEVAPFWREIGKWAAEVAPDVKICFELHPGAAVFNPATFHRLSEVVGPNVGVNLDPSHFWWQGMDPVAVIEAVGPAIHFAHGKDTTIYEDRVRLNGILDPSFPVDPETSAWHFSTVGAGHSTDEWTRLIRALQSSGFDGVIAIEQEDPAQPAEASVEGSLATLRAALANA